MYLYIHTSNVLCMRENFRGSKAMHINTYSGLWIYMYIIFFFDFRKFVNNSKRANRNPTHQRYPITDKSHNKSEISTCTKCESHSSYSAQQSFWFHELGHKIKGNSGKLTIKSTGEWYNFPFNNSPLFFSFRQKSSNENAEINK